MSLANNIEFLRRLPKLNGINGLGAFGRGLAQDSPLLEVAGFGTNPGDRILELALECPKVALGPGEWTVRVARSGLGTVEVAFRVMTNGSVAGRSDAFKPGYNDDSITPLHVRRWPLTDEEGKALSRLPRPVPW